MSVPGVRQKGVTGMHRMSHSAAIVMAGLQIAFAGQRTYAERTPCLSEVTLQGFDICDITGLSANGLVAVGIAIRSSDSSQAFTWSNGSFGNLGGFWVPRTSATATNRDGSVCVGGIAFNGVEWPVAWGRNGTPYEVLSVYFQDPVGNAMFAGASDISDDGTIIVGTAQGQAKRAVRWTSTDNEIIPLPTGAGSSSAYGCSGDGGTVVGDAGFRVSQSSSTYRAFRWTAQAGSQALEELPGTVSSSARATSTDGSAIVGYGNTASSRYAFRWSGARGMEDLGTLPGFMSADALGVSGDGSIVAGACSRSDTYIPNGAFVWTDQNGMQSVASLLLSRGVDLTGWDDLRGVSSISKDGSVIAGVGVFKGKNASFVIRGLFPASCSSDLDGDAAVNSGDLALLLLEFGAADPCSPDLDESGFVDTGDLAIMLLDFGRCS